MRYFAFVIKLIFVSTCLAGQAVMSSEKINQSPSQSNNISSAYKQLKSVADSIAPDSTGMSNLNSVEFAKKFRRGWNVGNSLEATGGETAWGNPLITQKLIDSVKAAGFNAVRIPVAWSKFTDTILYTIDPAWMTRVEEVVNYVLKDSMYAIINEHWDGGWIQPTQAKQEYVTNRLAAIWQQVAVHFRNYSDHLLFAGTNEVMVNGNYGTPTKEYYTVQNGFNQTFVNTVRSTGGHNVYRYLLVQGFNTNINNTVSYFVLPEDVIKNRLMVEVHYYDPFDFTINASSGIIEWGNSAPDATKTETWANESYADGQFQKMKVNFVNNGCAVIIGEYGAMARLNLGSSELNDIHKQYRLYYMQYITQSIVYHGLVPFYWDSGYTGDNASGLFNRSTGSKAYPDIIDAVVDTSYIIGPMNIKTANASLLKLFPNPAKGFINLEMTNQNIKYSQLCDLSGQVIQSINIKNGLNTYDISNLKPGIYFVRISTTEGFITQKLIKD
jgi:endoglucanase